MAVQEPQDRSFPTRHMDRSMCLVEAGVAVGTVADQEEPVPNRAIAVPVIGAATLRAFRSPVPSDSAYRVRGMQVPTHAAPMGSQERTDQ